VTIEIIISTRNTAAANTLLLLLLPLRCHRISKRAPATAKTALPPSCHLRRQAGHRRRTATTSTSAATLPTLRYHCLQNIKNVTLLTNLFFATMVTAAHNDNGRNQLTCIEKDKPKNNNKIRQHEKKNHLSIPSFLFPYPTPILLNQLPLQLSLLSITTTASNACSQPSHPPLPLSLINYHRHRDD
jgi:hypothetical protein